MTSRPYCTYTMNLLMLVIFLIVCNTINFVNNVSFIVKEALEMNKKKVCSIEERNKTVVHLGKEDSCNGNSAAPSKSNVPQGDLNHRNKGGKKNRNPSSRPNHNPR